ncbi:hypothetical protein LTR10_010431 [Elasticomyces elasticus]|nr:hypothetical protein LTR10_010431 [Elasticomyces elasticus]KAK4972331.1 hypothetical protein LTR42_006839 [Elasticomyces elasticus]
MASPPLTKLPTDVMYMIFDLLCIDRLCDFRLVCHWSRVQSEEYFASRAYRHKIISIEGRSIDLVRGADRIFRDNITLAAAVQTLSIRWRPKTYPEYYKTGFQHVPYLTSEVPDIFTTLSGLKSLDLRGMTSRTLESYFTLQQKSSVGGASLSFEALGTCWPRLESLSLTRIYLMSQELIAVIQRAGPGLIKLELQGVHTFEGKWVGTLRAIRSSASNIKSLRLRCLYDNTDSPKSACRLMFRDENDSILDKSCGGTSTLSLRGDFASMKGVEAIELGLKMIAEHLVERAAAKKCRSQEG